MLQASDIFYVKGPSLVHLGPWQYRVVGGWGAATHRRVLCLDFFGMLIFSMNVETVLGMLDFLWGMLRLILKCLSFLWIGMTFSE